MVHIRPFEDFHITYKNGRQIVKEVVLDSFVELRTCQMIKVV